MRVCVLSTESLHETLHMHSYRVEDLGTLVVHDLEQGSGMEFYTNVVVHATVLLLTALPKLVQFFPKAM